MKVEVSLFIGGSVVKEVVVVEQFSQADVLTKAQGYLKNSEIDLSTNIYNSDEA